MDSAYTRLEIGPPFFRFRTCSDKFVCPKSFNSAFSFKPLKAAYNSLPMSSSIDQPEILAAAGLAKYSAFRSRPQLKNSSQGVVCRLQRLEGECRVEGFGQTNLSEQVLIEKWGQFSSRVYAESDPRERPLIGAVVVFKDITERKTAQEELTRKAAELTQKGSGIDSIQCRTRTVAFVASHDLQEPLPKNPGVWRSTESQMPQCRAGRRLGLFGTKCTMRRRGCKD